MYINQRDGTFVDEAMERGALLPAEGSFGAGAADFDNDGDIDIVVGKDLAPHPLLVNDGTGHFTLNNTMLTEPSKFATSPSWGDIDNDGRLELSLGEWARVTAEESRQGNASPGDPADRQFLWMYKNEGNGVLKPYEFRSSPVVVRYVFAPRFADVNGDRFADLPVVADFGGSQLYINVGGGKFENVTATHGVGVDEAGMGSAIGDYDNDGDLDWFVSSIADDEPPDGEVSVAILGNRLYRNNGDGTFDDVTDEAGVSEGNWGWGAAFGDLDNDGDLDIYHVTGWALTDRFDHQPAILFENLGDGTFAEVAASVGADDRGQGRGVVLIDFDNDGDLDIFINNNKQLNYIGDTEFREVAPGIPTLLRNDTNNGNHWLKVTLDGVPPLHPDGIGSRVYIRTGDQVQMRELHASTNYAAQEPGRIAHFGIGSATIIDEVRGEWVNGDATVLTNVSVDQAISIPSASAILSSRSVKVGQAVLAASSLASPFEVPGDWVVDGESYADPVTITFDTPGFKELQLSIHSADGSSRLRTEVLRITVEAPDPGG